MLQTFCMAQSNHGCGIAKTARGQALQGLLQRSLVIPALRTLDHLEAAARCSSSVVFILTGTPLTLPEAIRQLTDADKVPIVNVDLISGLKGDAAGIGFLWSCGARGIISTHIEPLRAISNLGGYAIQRTFALDSAAVHTLMRGLESFQPEAVEVLPGILAPRILTEVRSHNLDLTLLGGGLIQSFKEIEELMQSGITAVSISNPSFWLV
jgi:glycerol uptake operon antiterminator